MRALRRADRGSIDAHRPRPGVTMRVLARLGAHGGAWMAVALLSTAAGTVAAGVAPMVERTDDEALRLMVEAAPSYLDRDLLFIRRADGALTPIAAATALPRSEERRVGKAWRCGGGRAQQK